MTNLEWINKQILLVKQNIQYHKDLLAESEEEYTDEIISAIKLLEPELQTLQQIKEALEAWEIVKKRRSYAYITRKNLFDLSVMLSIDDPNCEKLLKALEVNNNENNNS